MGPSPGQYDLLILKIAWLRIAQRRVCGYPDDEYWAQQVQTLSEALYLEVDHSPCEIAPIRWALDIFSSVCERENEVSVALFNVDQGH